MGGLRPIGSEKLEGMDKINRIMEIARYKENIPQQVNETKSTEYSIDLADGNVYRIEKERQGYIIKVAINESESQYIDNIKSRKYYPSYSQALKRLNFMAKEINVLHENEEGISLIGEQKKKFVLKIKNEQPKSPKSETPPPPAAAPPPPAAAPPAPATPPLPPPPADLGAGAVPPPPADLGAGSVPPPPADLGAGAVPPPPAEMTEQAPVGGQPDPNAAPLPPPPADPSAAAPSAVPPPPPAEGEMPPPEMGAEEEEVDIEEKPKEKKVSELKRIQILVGKLAQKIRSYEEQKDLSNKEIKYIVNSIISAIDVEVLDEDDIEQIIDKLEGSEEEGQGGEEEEVSFEEEDTEQSPEVAPAPPAEPEMAEGYDNLGDAFQDMFGGAYSSMSTKKLGSELSEMNEFDDFDEFDNDYHRERRRGRKHIPTPERFTHGTFAESKVDRLLSKYFILNEDEVKNYELKKERKTNQTYKINKENIVRLSESAEQLDTALDYIRENPRVKLIGLSTKGNLIFKEGINEVKVTKTGRLI